MSSFLFLIFSNNISLTLFGSEDDNKLSPFSQKLNALSSLFFISTSYIYFKSFLSLFFPIVPVTPNILIYKLKKSC